MYMYIIIIGLLLNFTLHRVVKWLSQKYRTFAVPASVAPNIELLAYALPGITCSINFIQDKEPKYRTFRLNSGYMYLATLTLPDHEPLVWAYGFNTSPIEK